MARAAPNAPLAFDDANPHGVDRGAGAGRGGVNGTERLVELDVLASRLDLGERLLADFADLRQRLLDLVRALKRDALGDRRAGHQSVRKCLA